MNTSELPLSSVIDDRRLQSRKSMKPEFTAELAEWLAEDPARQLPPVGVVNDISGCNWLYDGFHRFDSYKAAGRTSIPVSVVNADYEAAQALSLGSNAEHGLRRTREDKHHAVHMALEIPHLANKSDRELALIANVSHTFIAQCRSERRTQNSDVGVAAKDDALVSPPEARPAEEASMAPKPAEQQEAPAKKTAAEEEVKEAITNYENARAALAKLVSCLEKIGLLNDANEAIFRIRTLVRGR